MNVVQEYRDTIAELRRVKPRSQRAATLQGRATELMKKILQKGERMERKARRVS